MNFKAFVTALLIQLCSAAALQAETVHLSAAASLKDVLTELKTTYAATHKGTEIQPNFGASGALAKQIEQGAPADIFVSASQEWVKHLADKHITASGTEKMLAFNQLVFIGGPQTTDFTLEKVAALKRVAIGSPQNVPAGQYAKQSLEEAGIYAAMEREKKFVHAVDVRQALMYADQEEVDGAFVYKTDALLAKKAKIILTVPENLHDKIAYPMLLTAAGAKKAEAKSFYEYLGGPEAKAVLEKHGFEVSK